MKMYTSECNINNWSFVTMSYLARGTNNIEGNDNPLAKPGNYV